MTPYIENNLGERFEFEANYSLKRKYEKEKQKQLQKIFFRYVSEEQLKEIKENGKEEKEVIKDIVLNNDIDLDEVNKKVDEKYIKILLVETNKISEEKAEEIVYELLTTYGEEAVYERFEKILNKVFTQVGSPEYKTMPTWGME